MKRFIFHQSCCSIEGLEKTTTSQWVIKKGLSLIDVECYSCGDFILVGCSATIALFCDKGDRKYKKNPSIITSKYIKEEE